MKIRTVDYDQWNFSHFRSLSKQISHCSDGEFSLCDWTHITHIEPSVHRTWCAYLHQYIRISMSNEHDVEKLNETNNDDENKQRARERVEYTRKQTAAKFSGTNHCKPAQTFFSNSLWYSNPIIFCCLHFTVGYLHINVTRLKWRKKKEKIREEEAKEKERNV